MRLLSLAGVVLAALAGPLEKKPAEFDKADYPALTLAQVTRSNPCRTRTSYEVKDRMFSAELVYQGAMRDTPPKRFELVRRWARQLGDPEAAPRYRREISVADGRRVHWMPVPEGLLPILETDLRPGDRALAYLVFVGCVDRAPVFTIDEFEALDPAAGEDEDVIVKKPSTSSPA